ncbi:Endoplasmin [Vanrija pseudolonga]|uniref:Endoplasmin n=1 Tax=Vanrija pseudolonga TaxID=143232 RepID=A0AAF1BF73_9TREE|nr:Endoplasmin [Vanrija pseudolonga]
MKLQKLLIGAAALLVPFVAADGSAGEEAETFKYESDISRLRSLVIHSLYSHKDVFLREVISNANDALEKLRLTSLTDRDVLSAGEPNITITVDLDEGGKTGKLIIRDTGIGMNKTELARNLGTIARSGTNEFLKRADDAGAVDSNLIGQFGLGFYSCFLVSPVVRVSSLPPATAEHPDPVQHTFVSTASGDTFEVFADPRGNTLGRGTEIILDIGDEDEQFLSTNNLKALIDKHSTFSTTFPIYIREKKPPKVAETKDEDEEFDDADTQDDDEDEDEFTFVRVNDKAPIWMRDPKSVSKEDYIDFYKAVAKDQTQEPLGWSHFKGDTQSGVSFRSIMYIPPVLEKDFWSKITSGLNNVRLMVKRVFITDDLGEQYMPRWLSFLKVTVDADDLPLNVSRETLQNSRFLKQLQRILVRKAIDLFTKLAGDDPEKYKEVSKLYGNALRIGMMESQKDKIKIAKLLRFESTRSPFTSLEEYVENRKEGQKQIYYIAGVGETTQALSRSPFVEKLKARGYEILLLNLPSDEPMMGALNNFMGMQAQDVSKKGLKYGDEEEDEAEKKELAAQNIAYKPLLAWLKKELEGKVSDVVLTNRLVTSPCTIVVDSMGWSANMARIMASQAEAENDPMYQLMKNLPRVLEINPKSPLIEGLLEHVIELPEGDDEPSAQELEIKQTISVLFDTTLVRSGFDVADPTSYFERVELLLRRSLGVSSSARAEDKVKPAPPTAANPLPEDTEHDKAESILDGVEFGSSDDKEGEADEWLDWNKFKASMDDDTVHDEL